MERPDIKPKPQDCRIIKTCPRENIGHDGHSLQQIYYSYDETGQTFLLTIRYDEAGAEIRRSWKELKNFDRRNILARHY